MTPNARLSREKLKHRLVARAQELGFDLCRVTRSDAIPLAPQRLAQWIEADFYGDMDWMPETQERRGAPQKLWPEARSVIMLAMSYGPDGDALANLATSEIGNISVYARHRDYHDLIKGRLKLLGSFLAAQGIGELKVFVDTAPVMEKPLAQAAGLGWQGKHTNLVSRELGSWFFLGAIFTNADLEPDAPEIDHCGSCRACLDACPTQAFPFPYQLDARRCISYLTIEHKGHIGAEFRQNIGNRIYGCDDCLAACPWNKFAVTANEAKLQARADLIEPRLDELLALDDAAFRNFFSGNPVKRIGITRFTRNVLIAVGNSGDASFAPQVMGKLRDESPLIRAMAVWALARLLEPQAFRNLADAHRGAETDPDVLREWSPGAHGQETGLSQ